MIINSMRLRKFLTIPLIILGLLVIIQLSRSIINIYGGGGRVGELAAEVVELQKEKEELEREKAFRQTQEFVEREARDKLRMVKDGERIVVLPDTQKNAETNVEERGKVIGEESRPNWKRWIDFWLR